MVYNSYPIANHEVMTLNNKKCTLFILHLFTLYLAQIKIRATKICALILLMETRKLRFNCPPIVGGIS